MDETIEAGGTIATVDVWVRLTRAGEEEQPIKNAQAEVRFA